MALQDDKQKHISNWQASGLSQAAIAGRDDIKLPALILVTIKPAEP